MQISAEIIFHGIEAVGAIGIVPFLWKLNRAVNRWLDITREYPPHAHINGTIKYPVGMEPGTTVPLMRKP